MRDKKKYVTGQNLVCTCKPTTRRQPLRKRSIGRGQCHSNFRGSVPYAFLAELNIFKGKIEICFRNFTIKNMKLTDSASIFLKQKV